MFAVMSDPSPRTSEPYAGERAKIARLKRREPLAFQAFVVEHQRAIFGLFSRMLGRGPHVEDLAQETFLRAYRALPEFDPDGPAKLGTWLYTIATRLALDERKRRRPERHPLAEPAEGTDERTPYHEHATTQLRGAIERAANALPDDQCAVLVLTEVQGLSHGEVAEILGVPEATVKTRAFRAREKMKEALRPWKPQGDRR